MPKPSAPEANSAVGPGCRIRLHLEIHLPDGTTALSTWGEEPLALTLGDGTLTPGLEALLDGLRVGVEGRFLVDGDDLYGPHSADNIHWLPLAEFRSGEPPARGQVVAFGTPGGHELAGLVLEVDAERVRVDLNHPLSGKPLDIRAQVLCIDAHPGAPASEESLGQTRPPDLCSRS
jgi:FKBP-type peptidyl-prolyl cis-trans isomerase SlpA